MICVSMYEVVVFPWVPDIAKTFFFFNISPIISGPDLKGRELVKIYSTEAFPLDKALPTTYKSAIGSLSTSNPSTISILLFLR